MKLNIDGAPYYFYHTYSTITFAYARRVDSSARGYAAHNLLRCKARSIALRGCDHAAGKCCEKWARLFVRLDPCLANRRGYSRHSLLLAKQTEQFTSCTSVPNSYSQYFSTQWPIDYCTWFTASTLAVKSVFWHTHAIHVSLNTTVYDELVAQGLIFCLPLDCLTLDASYVVAWIHQHASSWPCFMSSESIVYDVFIFCIACILYSIVFFILQVYLYSV